MAHEIRRTWRRLSLRCTGCGVATVYHDSYEHSLGVVPLDPERATKILAFLTEEGLIDSDDLWIARAPALRAMLRVHDPDYIESLQRHEVVERIFGAPVTDEEIERVVEMQRYAVGGTIQATRLALQNRGVAVNLGGGQHHATRAAGLGFCLFNDIAVAVTRLRAKGFREPVLVVDLDVHDGNGTREIFAQDPSVHTYSIHGEDWGDTDAVASTSIALGADVGDEVYLGTLLKTLPEVFAATKPGLVIYLAGADPAADDVLGELEDLGAGDDGPRPVRHRDLLGERTAGCPSPSSSAEAMGLGRGSTPRDSSVGSFEGGSSSRRATRS